MANEKNILEARISLRRDTSKNWNKYADQILLDGELAIMQSDGVNNLTRIVVGNGASNLINLLGSESNMTTGSGMHNPMDRSKDYSVFYSGIGAGYRLPTATEEKLGGIKIDNKLFQITNDKLFLRHLYLTQEEGKGHLLHIGNGVNVEIDNSLYVHTLHATDHYVDLGHLLHLNKNIITHVQSLMSQKWLFFNEIDPLVLKGSFDMENIPFFIEFSIEKEEKVTVEKEEFWGITIHEGAIYFVKGSENIMVYTNSNGWVDDKYKLINFTNNNIINYSYVTYINKMLAIGEPLTTEEEKLESMPTPLNESSKPYGGIVINNWMYEGGNREKSKNAFIGIDWKGAPLFSNAFNPQTNIIQDTRYLLYSVKDLLIEENNNKMLLISSSINGYAIDVKKVDDIVNTSYIKDRITTDELGMLSLEILSGEGQVATININHKKVVPDITDQVLRTEDYDRFITSITLDEYGHVAAFENTDASNLCQDIVENKESVERLDENVEALWDEVDNVYESITSTDIDVATNADNIQDNYERIVVLESMLAKWRVNFKSDDYMQMDFDVVFISNDKLFDHITIDATGIVYSSKDGSYIQAISSLDGNVAITDGYEYIYTLCASQKAKDDLINSGNFTRQ